MSTGIFTSPMSGSLGRFVSLDDVRNVPPVQVRGLFVSPVVGLKGRFVSPFRYAQAGPPRGRIRLAAGSIIRLRNGRIALT